MHGDSNTERERGKARGPGRCVGSPGSSCQGRRSKGRSAGDEMVSGGSAGGGGETAGAGEWRPPLSITSVQRRSTARGSSGRRRLASGRPASTAARQWRRQQEAEAREEGTGKREQGGPASGAREREAASWGVLVHRGARQGGPGSTAASATWRQWPHCRHREDVAFLKKPLRLFN